ncbi:hypothetical protein [Planomicrobium sp. CPCC 101079]|uniref:hypothetical protein n=1 Tax=Planomicrobium sp. CPCC 101079 TaxID=2599618 RepID=UPI0011B79C05|nr:hypothetical protein [Planomicrobium sp. CPCC 101079]TWT03609.1 hypothetical protein FQV28_11360 [Planomicrobium sp. CPCC 101079]
MLKKTLIVLTFSLILSGCAGGKNDGNVAGKVRAEEQLEEQVIEVDLTSLEGKIWTSSEEESYLYFTDVNENTIEFKYLSPAGYKMQEQTFIVEIANVTANSIEGSITKATNDSEAAILGLEKSQVKLTRKNNLYEISIENLLDFEIVESTLTSDEWNVAKNTVKELTESEALELIYQAEATATKSFSEAFTENAEGFSFNKPFETIASTVQDYYTKDYPLHDVYEDPSVMYETLYAFPLSEIPKENFLVDATAEKVKIYYEADLYGSSALYLYTLVIEDGLWKIDSRDSLLSPAEAEYAALTLSDSSKDPEALARTIESHDFHDYIETVLTGSRYHIEVYDEYEGGTQTYGFYQVDPVTRIVYAYDRVRDIAFELGTAY